MYLLSFFPHLTHLVLPHLCFLRLGEPGSEENEINEIFLKKKNPSVYKSGAMFKDPMRTKLICIYASFLHFRKSSSNFCFLIGCRFQLIHLLDLTRDLWTAVPIDTLRYPEENTAIKARKLILAEHCALCHVYFVCHLT